MLISNIIHRNKQQTPLYARVLNVDNARETVQNNEIRHDPTACLEEDLARSNRLGCGKSWSVTPLRPAPYMDSIRREVPRWYSDSSGTTILAEAEGRVVGLAGTDTRHKAPTNCRQHAAPYSNTKEDAFDLTNLIFWETHELITAFGEAGWMEADNLNVGSALKVAQATMRNTGYSDARFVVALQGRPPMWSRSH